MLPSEQSTRYKSFQQIFKMVCNLCLSLFYMGYAVVAVNTLPLQFVLTLFQTNWNPSTAQGILVGLLPLGSVLGCACASRFISTFSRRQCLFLLNASAALICVLSLIKSFQMLLFCRFISGICVGLFSSVVPMMVKELVPLQISGTFGVFSQIFITLGVFFAYVFTLILSSVFDQPQSYWKLIFLFPITVFGLQTYVLLRVYPYETPKFLLSKGQNDQLKSLLKDMYFSQYIDEIMKDLVADAQACNKSSSSNPRSAVITAYHLPILQQYIGVNAVINYSREIVGGFFPSLKTTIPLLVTFLHWFMALVCIPVLAKVGRRAMLQGGTVGCTVSLLAISFGFFTPSAALSSILLVGGLISFMCSFGMTLGPVVWMYVPEIVSPNTIGIATLMNWAAATSVIVLFPILMEVVPNTGYLFMLFAFWGIGSYFVNDRLLIETAGKTERQIREEFKMKDRIYFPNQMDTAGKSLKNMELSLLHHNP